MNILEALMRAFWPRRLANESDDHYRWRQGVAMSSTIVAGALATQIALVWGFVPFFGGFVTTINLTDALREEGQQLKTSIQQSHDDLKSSADQQELFNLRRRQCMAIHDQNMILARTIGEQIEVLRAEYYRLTKTSWEMRPCEEF